MFQGDWRWQEAFNGPADEPGNAQTLEEIQVMEARTAVRSKWLKIMLGVVAMSIEDELSAQRDRCTARIQVKR